MKFFLVSIRFLLKNVNNKNGCTRLLWAFVGCQGYIFERSRNKLLKNYVEPFVNSVINSKLFFIEIKFRVKIDTWYSLQRIQAERVAVSRPKQIQHRTRIPPRAAIPLQITSLINYFGLLFTHCCSIQTSHLVCT